MVKPAAFQHWWGSTDKCQAGIRCAISVVGPSAPMCRAGQRWGAHLSWLEVVFVCPTTVLPGNASSHSFPTRLPSTPGPTTSRSLPLGPAAAADPPLLAAAIAAADLPLMAAAGVAERRLAPGCVLWCLSGGRDEPAMARGQRSDPCWLLLPQLWAADGLQTRRLKAARWGWDWIR